MKRGGRTQLRNVTFGYHSPETHCVLHNGPIRTQAMLMHLSVSHPLLCIVHIHRYVLNDGQAKAIKSHSLVSTAPFCVCCISVDALIFYCFVTYLPNNLHFFHFHIRDNHQTTQEFESGWPFQYGISRYWSFRNTCWKLLKDNEIWLK